MSDLRQVAEKYRNMLNIHKPVSPAVILADAMTKELDPTPLTQNKIMELGGKIGFAGWVFDLGGDGRQLAITECDFGEYQYFRLRIYTVGQLITLMRLHCSGAERP